MTSPRQTRSFLQERLKQAGIRPSARRGQNFLVDLNLLGILVEAARLEPSDVVLEVGAAAGSLTARLAPHVAAVVAVEIDPGLARLAHEALGGLPNVTLLRQDVLAGKNRLDPRVLAAVERHLVEGPGRTLKVVANLPFCVATPVISNLLAGDRPPACMTVTVQKEVADRLAARPATRAYGALSVWVQSQCDVELLRVLPPTAFWPRPKVSSAMVRIALRPDRRRALGDLDDFHRFVRTLFTQRRKLLRGVLAGAMEDRLARPHLAAVLRSLDVAGTARAEELSVEVIVALARSLHDQLGPP